MEKLIGQIIDNYKILEIIGRGGMGVVFKAIDMNLEKVVALKMIDPLLAKDENFLNRFKTEAKALARLGNINIVGVYALRETEFGLFMVMEYVKAKTISEWMREKGRFSLNETKEIARQVLNAIGHAHKVGVIHRDIKPNNILLCDDGTVKVMDFGLAKVAQDHSRQNTVTHVAAGTLYYMSPEQIKGLKNVDTRSDIYAIGMSLYEMLAGRTPFEKSESEFTIQKQIVEGKIPSPLKYNPLIPKSFVKFIMKAIDKDADKRFQTITEMHEGLFEIQIEDTSIEDKTRVLRDTIPPQQTVIKQKSKKTLYITASSIILIAVLLGVYFMGVGNDANEILKNNSSNKDVIVVNQTSLSISSEPKGAAVFINEKNIGKTPLFIDSLNSELIDIKIRLSGYELWMVTGYKLFEGKNSLNIPLKPVTAAATATLILKAEPEGSIYIGNRKLNSSNEAVTTEVAAGRHTIKFVHPQFGTKEQSVNLSPNETKPLTCYFQQQFTIQSLNTAGDAFWGTIYINGENTGKTTPGDTLLGPGTHRVTVKKSGFKTVEDEVVLSVAPSFEFKSRPLVFHLE